MALLVLLRLVTITSALLSTFATLRFVSSAYYSSDTVTITFLLLVGLTFEGAKYLFMYYSFRSNTLLLSLLSGITAISLLAISVMATITCLQQEESRQSKAIATASEQSKIVRQQYDFAVAEKQSLITQRQSLIDAQSLLFQKNYITKGTKMNKEIDRIGQKIDRASEKIEILKLKVSEEAEGRSKGNIGHFRRIIIAILLESVSIIATVLLSASSASKIAKPANRPKCANPPMDKRVTDLAPPYTVARVRNHYKCSQKKAMEIARRLKDEPQLFAVK